MKRFPLFLLAIASASGQSITNTWLDGLDASHARPALDAIGVYSTSNPPGWSVITGKPAFGSAALADSTAFASASHAHSAADITSGTIPDARIASAATWNAALQSSVAAATYAPISHTHAASAITSGTIADTYIASAATWNAKQSTLVSGTSIKTVNGTTLLGSGDISVATAAQGTKADAALPATTAATTYAPISHTQAFSTITSTPTTLAGYGITDAASSTYVAYGPKLTVLITTASDTVFRVVGSVPLTEGTWVLQGKCAVSGVFFATHGSALKLTLSNGSATYDGFCRTSATSTDLSTNGVVIGGGTEGAARPLLYGTLTNNSQSVVLEVWGEITVPTGQSCTAAFEGAKALGNSGSLYGCQVFLMARKK